MKRVLATAVSLAVSAGCLLLALRGADLSQAAAVIALADPRAVGIAALVLTAALAARAHRTRAQLGGTRTSSLATAFLVTAVAYLGNALLPARAGDVARVALFVRATGLSAPYVLGVVVTERLLDAVLLVAVGVWVAASLGVELGVSPGHATAGGLLLGLTLLVGAALARRHSEAIGELLPDAARRGRIVRAVQHMVLGVVAIREPKRAGGFLLLTASIWFLDAVATLSMATALGLSLTLGESFLLLTAFALASVIPSAPGQIGVNQLVGVLVLTASGHERTESLALSILLQATTLLVLLVWGGIGLIRIGWTESGK